MNQEKLETLILDLIDGSIDSEDFTVLENELRSNPEAIETYVALSRVENLLHVSSEINKNAFRFVIPMESILKKQRSKTIKIALLSTAAVLLIGLMTLKLFMLEDKSPALAFEVSPGTQYTLTHSKKNEAIEGLVLEKGSRLKLSQGVVELTFKSGVKSIIIAPAEITLLQDDILKMEQGTAWFQVPKGEEGFTVHTKELKVVDLGTEFGVLAEPDKDDEVHVLNGEVEVTSKRDLKGTATLAEGDARRINSLGRFTIIERRDSLFLTSLPKTLPYLHWSFDQDQGYQASGTLPQASEIQTTLSSTPKMVTGKYGSALSLDGKGQHLITDWSGFSGKRPRTVSFWLKLPENAPQSILFPGIVAWGDRNTHLGKWKIAISEDNPMKKSHLRLSWGDVWMTSVKPLAKEEWIHVLVTSTGMLNEQGLPMADFYINGQLAKTKYETKDQNLTRSKFGTVTNSPAASPVLIGSDLISENRNTLHAQIDELYIIDGAMNEQQAQQWKNLSVKD